MPILNITLRNNLLDALPFKRWIEKAGCCLCLLNDKSNNIKGLWSIILSIPVFGVVLFYRKVQDLVAISGGIFGAFILLIIPGLLSCFARRRNMEEKLDQANPNRSPFGCAWVVFVIMWAGVTITSVAIKLASGGTGE